MSTIIPRTFERPRQKGWQKVYIADQVTLRKGVGQKNKVRNKGRKRRKEKKRQGRIFEI